MEAPESNGVVSRLKDGSQLSRVRVDARNPVRFSIEVEQSLDTQPREW